MSDKRYVIVNTEEPELAWSNDYGWGEGDAFEVFSEKEIDMLSLPMGGHWELEDGYLQRVSGPSI